MPPARPDLVDRDFSAERPDQLWVVDLTYNRSWVGSPTSCWVIDLFARRVLGSTARSG
jgi:putative transposase